MHKMRFAKSRLTEYKERVVGTTRCVSHRNGCGVSELAARTNYEIFKSIRRVYQRAVSRRGLSEWAIVSQIRGLTTITAIKTLTTISSCPIKIRSFWSLLDFDRNFDCSARKATRLLTNNIKKVILDPNSVKFAVSSYCLLYTSPSPRDRTRSRMPSSA